MMRAVSCVTFGVGRSPLTEQNSSVLEVLLSRLCQGLGREPLWQHPALRSVPGEELCCGVGVERGVRCAPTVLVILLPVIGDECSQLESC